eukprot:COSAG04_NODE_563_length_12569_cov_28.278655_3_plen_256_part_00
MFKGHQNRLCIDGQEVQWHEQLLIQQDHGDSELHITKDFLACVLAGGTQRHVARQGHWDPSAYTSNLYVNDALSQWILLAEGSFENVKTDLVMTKAAREKRLRDRVIASYLSNALASSDESLSSRQTALEHLRISPGARRFVATGHDGYNNQQETILLSQALAQVDAAVKVERETLKAWGAATRKWWVAASAQQRHACRCKKLKTTLYEGALFKEHYFDMAYRALTNKADFDAILRSIDCPGLKAAQIKEMREHS